jgi:hypothetical protein
MKALLPLVIWLGIIPLAVKQHYETTNYYTYGKPIEEKVWIYYK